MGRELRIVGFVVLAAIAFSFLANYNKKLKSDEFSALLIDARGLWPIAR